MAKSGKTLRDLFHDTLKDIYFAEKKISHNVAQDGQGRSERGP
jgi:ferritin-like metal-binding protein YciE